MDRHIKTALTLPWVSSEKNLAHKYKKKSKTLSVVGFKDFDDDANRTKIVYEQKFNLIYINKINEYIINRHKIT